MHFLTSLLSQKVDMLEYVENILWDTQYRYADFIVGTSRVYIYRGVAAFLLSSCSPRGAQGETAESTHSADGRARQTGAESGA